VAENPSLKTAEKEVAKTPVSPTKNWSRITPVSVDPANALPVKEEAERSEIGRIVLRSVSGIGTVVNENPAKGATSGLVVVTVYSYRVSAWALGAAKHKVKIRQSTATIGLNRLCMEVLILTRILRENPVAGQYTLGM
jgi:hypothetical protein